MEDYKTLAAPVSASITEKKSEFIAHAAPAENEEAALAVLEGVRGKHRTASHNVYAYVLRENARQRYSDDGEPAKTAGLPVLSVINGAGLQDVIIVVTRYFGGTLLGTGGLVRAYTAAAQAALKAGKVLQVRLCVELHFTLPYPLYEQAQRLLQAAGAKMEEPQFTDAIQIRATLPLGEEGPVLIKLRELSRGSMEIDVSEPFYTPYHIITQS